MTTQCNAEDKSHGYNNRGCCALAQDIYSFHPERVERKNSCNKRKPAPVSSGIFSPGHLTMAGRATDTRPERERSPHGLLRVLNLLAASWLRVRTLHEALKSQQGACHV